METDRALTDDAIDRSADALDDEALAFQTWALYADRNARETSRLVAEMYGRTVSHDLVRQWKRRHKWEERALTLYADLGPAFFDRTRSLLAAAGPPAAAYLLRVAAGLEAKPDRVRTIAAVAALDRVGFLPFTRKDAERGATPMLAGDGTASDDVATLSDDELDARLARRLRRIAGTIDTGT